MNFMKIYPRSVSDGPGIRVSIYVAGCRLHCKGCHNQEAWNFNAGEEYTYETENHILDLLSKPYIKGLSILGGEPLDDYNRKTISNLIRSVKSRYPEKDIWLWTGYEIEEIKNFSCIEMILNNIDAIITGRFELDKRDITSNNLWKGSTNQKITYLK